MLSGYPEIPWHSSQLLQENLFSPFPLKCFVHTCQREIFPNKNLFLAGSSPLLHTGNTVLGIVSRLGTFMGSWQFSFSPTPDGVTLQNGRDEAVQIIFQPKSRDLLLAASQSCPNPSAPDPSGLFHGFHPLVDLFLGALTPGLLCCPLGGGSVLHGRSCWEFPTCVFPWKLHSIFPSAAPQTPAVPFVLPLDQCSSSPSKSLPGSLIAAAPCPSRGSAQDEPGH